MCSLNMWEANIFFINAIKNACEKHLLLKHVFLACRETHINLICGLYKISYKPVYIKNKNKKKDAFVVGITLFINSRQIYFVFLVNNEMKGCFMILLNYSN